MSLIDNLNEYRVLAEEATPGPWKADGEERGDCVVWGPNGRFLMNAQAEPHWVPDPSGRERAVAFDADQRDTKFIAASRSIAPQLIKAVDEALFIADKFDVDAETKVRLMIAALTGELKYSSTQDTGE